MATLKRTAIEASNPSTDSPPTNPSPNSPPPNPSPMSPTTSCKRPRVPQIITWNDDPSPQEIAEFTLMGGNLSDIDAYVRKWSRDGASFSGYELMLDRIFRYYRNFLAQSNRARFEEETTGELGYEGESSRQANQK